MRIGSILWGKEWGDKVDDLGYNLNREDFKKILVLGK